MPIKQTVRETITGKRDNKNKWQADAAAAAMGKTKAIAAAI